MRKLVIAVLTITFTLSIGIAAHAQSAKPADQTTTTPVAKDQPTTPAANKDAEQPDEVEQMLAEAKKRSETVLGTCLDDCGNNADKLRAGIVSGRVLALPKPAYPPLARAAHAAGTVEVRVLIGLDGKVIAAVAISGHPLLYAASVKAARESEFTPTKWHGEPVKVTGVIQYNFVPQ